MRPLLTSNALPSFSECYAVSGGGDTCESASDYAMCFLSFARRTSGCWVDANSLDDMRSVRSTNAVSGAGLKRHSVDRPLRGAVSAASRN